MQQRKPDYLRIALIFSLLVLLPAVFSLLLGLHVIDIQQQLAREEVGSRIDIRADTLLANLDAENIFAPLFRKLSRQILPLTAAATNVTPGTAHPAAAQIADLAATTLAKASQTFQLAAFDHEGHLIETGQVADDARQAFKYLWDAVTGSQVSNEYTGRKADVARTFGREFSIRQIARSNDICHPTFNYGQHGLFYHCRAEGGKNGMIVFIELALDFESLLSENVKLASNLENPVIARNSSGKLLHGSDFSADPDQLFALAAASADGFIHDNRLWKKVSIRDAEILIGQTINLSRYRQAGFFATTAAVLLVLACLLVLVRNLRHGQQAWLSIRYKLVGIFVFAVYLPVLGLFLLGFNGLRDHRTVLENEARKGIQDLLFKIDSDFSRKEAEIFATFERFYHDRSWHQKLDGTWNEADAAIRRSARANPTGENFFNWLEVRDIQQNQLYSTSQGEANDRIKAMGRTMSLIGLEKFVPQRLHEAGIKMKQSDMILVNLLENPVIGFSHLFEQPGKMVQMEFEGSNVYWYWNYYPEADSRVAFFAGNSKVQYNAINYLNTRLKSRYNLGNTSLRVIAYHPNIQLWTPESARSEKELQRLVKLSGLNNMVESARITYDQRRYIATCLPGVKLRDAFICCLFPEAEIDYKIAMLRSQIFLGMALILLISVLTGLLLSKTLLRPVGELSLGLKALRQRNTDFRVQIINQDELGELGNTFNQMMVEVKEMLIAGAVQQCLIPASCPPVAGYESLIYNKMATDVGGDYADFFTLPGDRYLIVLGDVTGHGVSSSILTAMVKAMVFRFADKNAALPVILRSLSEMIFELLKRRKLMTFCAMILDRNNNTFTMANAGHPFPVLCSASGETRLIEHNSLPLGVSLKRSRYEVVEGTLEPGDIMLLYTDGIAEATDARGEIFGFRRVEKLLAEHRKLGVDQIRDVLLKEFWQHYQREELDDDLTFILVKRQPAGAE